MKTYIIHFSKLKERRGFLETSQTIKALNPEFITEKDIEGKINGEPPIGKIGNQVKTIQHILLMNLCEIGKINLQRLTKREKECIFFNFKRDAINAYSQKNYELSLQHYRAYEHFLNTNDRHALILEDDSLPIYTNPSNTIRTIGKMIEKLENDNAFFLDISDSLGLQGAKNQYSKDIIDKVENGRTRCSSSYIINRKLAEELIRKKNEIALPIDWHLSYVMKSEALKTYWSTIILFIQGSENYIYKSNQEDRNYRN